MTEGIEKQERYAWVDYARVVAILGVILVHAGMPATLSFGDRPLSAWWAGNVTYIAGKLATPFFFMISGFLLLPKEESLEVLWKKRILRMIPPLLVWSVFYLFVNGYRPTDAWDLARDVVGLVIHPAEYHLWFMYTILGLYMVLPFLRLIIKHAEPELITYYLAVWVLAVGILPWVGRFSMKNSFVDLFMVAGHAGYLVLGYVLAKLKLTRRVVWLAAGAVFVGFTFTVVGTYIRTVANGGMLEGAFTERLYPNMVMYSGGMWILVRAAVEKFDWLRRERPVRLMRTLGKTTFGVYLVHAFVITVLGKGWLGFKLNCLVVHPVLGIPMMTVVIYVLSLGLTLVLRRVPVVKRVV